MTQARRALTPRRKRGVWLLITVPLVLLVTALLILLGISRQVDLGTLPNPLPSPQSGSSAAVDPTPTPAPHHTTPPGKTKAAAALKACRAKVQAADKVMAAGRNGMRHWSQHVQAQTDAFAGRITIKKMDDIFDRTMKAGDEDEARYTEAIKDHEHLDGSCGAVGGAPAEISSQLARCAKRGRAQRLVLAAAADGMADWTKHLGDMRRSKQGKIHNPQKKWLKTWRARHRTLRPIRRL